MLYTPPPDLGLTILYQDQHCVALDKPSGLLSVPGRGEDKQDCLYQRALQHYPELYVIHRLDMDTSGILLFARHPEAQRRFSALFQQRQISKCYRAQVEGQLTPEQGAIELPLHTDWPNRPRQKVDWQHGKHALTFYRLLQHQGNNSQVALYPVTGRSHQLRLHMLAIGHPIIGDRLYQANCPNNSRLALHASQLKFDHPFGQIPLNIESPWPL